MANWTDLSVDSLKAAKGLHASGHARSAASRAYFAAYAAVTSQLPESMTFAGGRSNPSHARLDDLLKSNVRGKLDETERKRASRIIRALRAHRVASDYDSSASIDRITSLKSVRDAAKLLDLLEVR